MSSTDSITFMFPSDSYDSSQVKSVVCTPSCTVSNLSLVLPGSLLNLTSMTIKFSIIGIINPASSKPPGVYMASWGNSGGTVLENYTTYFGGFDAGTLKCKQYS